MKKKYVVLLIAIATVIAILVTSIAALAFSFVYYYYLDTDTYHIPVSLCGYICGKDITPQEFCETNGKDTIFESIYTKAEVGHDGCLILTLSNYAVKQAKNESYYLHVLQAALGESRDIGVKVDYDNDPFMFLKFADKARLEISEDYTKVVSVNGDKSYIPIISASCIEMQIYSGKTCEEIHFEYLYLDKDGTVTERLTYTVEEGYETFYE